MKNSFDYSKIIDNYISTIMDNLSTTWEMQNEKLNQSLSTSISALSDSIKIQLDTFSKTINNSNNIMLDSISKKMFISVQDTLEAISNLDLESDVPETKLNELSTNAISLYQSIDTIYKENNFNNEIFLTLKQFVNSKNIKSFIEIIKFLMILFSCLYPVYSNNQNSNLSIKQHTETVQAIDKTKDAINNLDYDVRNNTVFKEREIEVDEKILSELRNIYSSIKNISK